MQTVGLTNDCEPSTVIPVVQNEQRIPTSIEKPPFNIAMAPLTTTTLQTGGGGIGGGGGLGILPTIGNYNTIPKVVGHTFHFFKTVLKPQVYRQIVTVPYIQKYARYFQVPVIETYHYQQEVPF